VAIDLIFVADFIRINDDKPYRRSLMKYFKLIAAAVVTFIILSSCQDVFTSSVFSFVETDISTMNDAQKVSYAEDLLATGSEEELEAAYAEIAAMVDELDLTGDLTADELELVELAADLAIGASGVGQAVTDALDALVSADETSDPDAIIDGILGGFDESDYDNLEDAVDLIEAAEANDAELTTEQYTNAATAQLLVVINDAGGVDNLDTVDPADPDLLQALDWAEAGGVDLSSMLGDLTIPE